MGTTDENITDVAKIQEFKSRLAALLAEFGGEISSAVNGDTHGVYDDRVIFYIGKQYFTLPTDCTTITPKTITASIGSEVVTPIPVKPVPVDPLSVFPENTRVRLRPDYVKSLHEGRRERDLALRGVVVVPEKPSQYVYILWDNTNRPFGYDVKNVEKLPDGE